MKRQFEFVNTSGCRRLVFGHDFDERITQGCRAHDSTAAVEVDLRADRRVIKLMMEQPWRMRVIRGSMAVPRTRSQRHSAAAKVDHIKVGAVDVQY